MEPFHSITDRFVCSVLLILFDLGHLLNFFALELAAAQFLVELHVQNLIGRLRLRSDNVDLLPVVVNLGRDVVHFALEVIKNAADTVRQGRAIDRFGSFVCAAAA